MVTLLLIIVYCIKLCRQQGARLDPNASSGQSGKETTQIRADNETDGDFTPTWGKK